jgi:hypothetical protein
MNNYENSNSLRNRKSEEGVQCHFISNTHWDREWRFSMQRTRYMLVYMLDMLLDILEKEPEFKSFHLDSQTVPVQDYLEVRPEKEEIIKKYISEGRLNIGPWFCLPDEYCVGGEALVRNLLLGHKIAKRFGAVSKTGYSPFSWGQISQMPQIYKGFGIDMISFYRGVNTLVAPKSEFIWEGPDGTQIYGSRLSKRPRYNVWYIIQRPAYWNEADENNRYMSWKNGHGPFKFIDSMRYELDYQFVHPKFEYHEENIPARVDQTLIEQDKDWSTPHRFWSAGHDTSCPDIREARMIADCQKSLGNRGKVFHSTVKEWQDGVIANKQEDWPIVYGEMHHPATEGSSSELIGWVTSSRTYIKQENFKTERDITYYAEPMAVFVNFLGVPYPQSFIDLSYNWLLQNHGHDSIAGCGRDITADDVMNRYRQSREISSCVIERAMMDIASSIDLSDWPSEDMAVVVYNPAAFKRTEVIPAVLEIPKEWECKSFEVFDDKGEKMAVQFCDKIDRSYMLAQNPNDTANFYPASKYFVRVEFKDVPGMGYRTFRVKPVKKPGICNPKSMVTSLQTMENEYVIVSINANGTFNVTDKRTARAYKGLGYFKDSSEIGNPWFHKNVPNESVYTTWNEKAQISLIRDGELEAAYRIELDWKLPEGVTADEKYRSKVMKPYKITSTVTLRKGQPWVDVVTDIDNTVENHYLQVSFPTRIKADKVAAQGQFDVVERPTAKPDYSIYKEEPMTENPMNSFVDVSDKKVGFALLNEGLKAYEVHDDADSTVSLSLLRGYPLRMYVTEFDLSDYTESDKGSQCLGKHSFHYAIMPHEGDWVKAGIWNASERFNLALHAALVGPTKHGSQPLEKSFLKMKDDRLHISAIKRSESGEGWIIRVFNPFDFTIDSSICLNGGYKGPDKVQSPVERLMSEFELPKEKGHRWTKVREVSLEELPVKELEFDEDGWVDFEITRKKIMTLEFLP